MARELAALLAKHPLENQYFNELVRKHRDEMIDQQVEHAAELKRLRDRERELETRLTTAMGLGCSLCCLDDFPCLPCAPCVAPPVLKKRPKKRREGG